MATWMPVAVSIPFILVLLASGAWANRHFAHHSEIPAHFDWRGRATRLAPRERMVRFVPSTLSTMLFAIAVLAAILPDEALNGDPVASIIACGAIFLAAQAFILWLTERWARSQQ